MNKADAARKTKALLSKAEGTANATEAQAFRAGAERLRAKYDVTQADLDALDADDSLLGGLLRGFGTMDMMYPHIERIEAALADAMIAVDDLADPHAQLDAVKMLYEHLRAMVDGTGNGRAYFPVKRLRNDILLRFYEATRYRYVATMREHYDEPEYLAESADRHAVFSTKLYGDLRTDRSLQVALDDARHRRQSKHRWVTGHFDEWKRRWLDPERKTWSQRRWSA